MSSVSRFHPLPTIPTVAPASRRPPGCPHVSSSEPSPGRRAGGREDQCQDVLRNRSRVNALSPPSTRRPACMRPASNHISIPADPSCTQRTPGRIDRRSSSTSSPVHTIAFACSSGTTRSAPASRRPTSRSSDSGQTQTLALRARVTFRERRALRARGCRSRRMRGQHVHSRHEILERRRVRAPPVRRGRGRRALCSRRGGDARSASTEARTSLSGRKPPASRQMTSAPSAGSPGSCPGQAHGEGLHHRGQPESLVAAERKQRAAVVERRRIGGDPPVSGSTIAPSGSAVPRDAAMATLPSATRLVAMSRMRREGPRPERRSRSGSCGGSPPIPARHAITKGGSAPPRSTIADRASGRPHVRPTRRLGQRGRIGLPNRHRCRRRERIVNRCVHGDLERRIPETSRGVDDRERAVSSRRLLGRHRACTPGAFLRARSTSARVAGRDSGGLTAPRQRDAWRYTPAFVARAPRLPPRANSASCVAIPAVEDIEACHEVRRSPQRVGLFIEQIGIRLA